MNRKSIASWSLAGLALLAAPFIIPQEGTDLVGKADIVGVATACHGHTATAIIGKRYTLQECGELYTRDFGEVSYKPMAKHIKVSLTEEESIAIASLVFNVGAQAITPGTSTLIKYLNAGRYKDACNQILQWSKAGGVECKANGSGCAGIWTRRLKERDVCLYGRAIVAARERLP